MAANVHFVKGSQFVSTALLLPKHRDKHNIGTVTRMPSHPRRCLRAVHSGLSESAQPAATSGKLPLHGVCRTIVDALVAVAKLWEGKQSNQHMKQRNTHCCLNGISSGMLQMAFIPTTPPLPATSLCIGIARSVQRDNCTSTERSLMFALVARLLGAHIVLPSKCANAILCKLISP